MSSCSCGWGNEVLGARVSGPHVARKPGFECGCCGLVVLPGELCVDTAGLYADDYAGFFSRQHADCHELVQRYKMDVCGFQRGEWLGTEDLSDMEVDALARSDEPFWRDWLIIANDVWDRQDARRSAGAA